MSQIGKRVKERKKESLQRKIPVPKWLPGREDRRHQENHRWKILQVLAL